MKILDAAEAVLTGAQEPLHNAELTKGMIAQRLWATDGKTPRQTVNACLAVDIKKHGANSRFQRTDKGIFALRSWGLEEYAGPTAKTAEKIPKKKASKKKSAKKKAAATSKKKKKKTLSFTEATVRVLEKFGKKKPMHYRAIADKALELGLVTTAGKTPEATLYAQVINEIQRKTKRGDRQRFVRHGKGFVGLSRWLPVGLAFQIDQNNQQIRKRLHQRIAKMPWEKFEELVGHLLGALGFVDIEVTSASGDNGIDVRGTMVTGDVIRTKMAVQVKRWKKSRNVRAPDVQQVRGSLGAHEQGLIITTSDFSKGAKSEAERPDATPVALMDGEHLVRLLAEQEIGIRSTPHQILELVQEGQEEA